MTALEFGRLEFVPVREAWPHEAHNFTPWLAENLERLGETLNYPLELMATEADVSGFVADILARGPDGAHVLIENQLEGSDHRHLGQIMTYLPGLTAKAVVWLAPSFHDAHLAAIRWLNENTKEDFSFFAVEVRVARIGASPMAPVFEVIERPNGWTRFVKKTADEADAKSDLSEFRGAFWSHFLARHPAKGPGGQVYQASSRWRSPTSQGFVVVQYLAKDSVGVFVRGNRGVASADVAKRLDPFRIALEMRLGVPMNANSFLFLKKLTVPGRDPANWDQMSDWLQREADAHVAALEEIVKEAD